MKRAPAISLIILLTAIAGAAVFSLSRFLERRNAFVPIHSTAPIHPTRRPPPFEAALMDALERQVKAGIRYQDGYFTGGDPPPNIGVCTDVLIRAFRDAGIDLQKAVAEDVREDSDAYGIERPDANIDHRRCRNLVVFFRRHALRLPTDSREWKLGDVVFWGTRGDGQADHVGMIASGVDESGSPTVVHHWPGLPVSETDGLHRFPILYHFRWRNQAGG